MAQPEQSRQPVSLDQVCQQGHRRDSHVRPCLPLCWQAAMVANLQIRMRTCSRVERELPKWAGFLPCWSPSSLAQRRKDAFPLRFLPAHWPRIQAKGENWKWPGRTLEAPVQRLSSRGQASAGFIAAKWQRKLRDSEGRFFSTREPQHVKWLHWPWDVRLLYSAVGFSGSLSCGKDSFYSEKYFRRRHVTYFNSNLANSLTFQIQKHSDLRWAFVLWGQRKGWRKSLVRRQPGSLGGGAADSRCLAGHPSVAWELEEEEPLQVCCDSLHGFCSTKKM